MTKADIQLVRSLADKRGRTEHGLFLAEGGKLIGELRASHLRVRKIYALEGIFEGPEVETVTPRDMERLSQLKTPSNSVALVEIPHYRLKTAELRNRLTLALDEVQNPGNVGTIIRLADWFGITDILCSEGTADCFNPKVVQATMGAILRVRVHYLPLAPLLTEAAAGGIPVYGTFLRRDGQRGPRRDARRCAMHLPKTLHPALARRPPRFGIAQRRHGNGNRLCRIPASNRHPEREIAVPKGEIAFLSRSEALVFRIFISL